VSLGSALFVWAYGWTLWYGDAEAHLDIARRITDAREPGYEQIGTVWLPLPHVLMAPFTAVDSLWRSGLGGTIPMALAFVLGGLMLFLALRRMFGPAAAAAGTAVYALNPNLLYLQSIPMTEPLSMACVCGVLWFAARFRDTNSAWDAAGAGAMAALGSLSRYEGWFVLPFAGLYFLALGGQRRWRSAIVFSVVAALGPLYWIGHNWILYSNPLEFYNGPWSAKAITARGRAPYPGENNWPVAWVYYREAVYTALGKPLAWIGAAGLLVACLRRAWWAAALALVVPAFYVMSVHSSGTPIFLPHLWPNSYYNSRFGVTAMPLAAVGVAAWASLIPGRVGKAAAFALVLACVSPWFLYPRQSTWVCWKESEVNSAARREWTRRAAEYLAPRYKPGAGIFMGFGDQIGILREAGIPLRETIHQGDGPLWQAAVARPDLFLWQEWAIALEGDDVSRAAARMRRGPHRFELVRTWSSRGAPDVQIWRHVQ
jgi:hypothetical protein